MKSEDCFIVVIPSRYCSSRFPGKPLAEINGIPMVKMVYDIVLTDDRISKVLVATDDSRIYDYCISAKISVLMTLNNHITGTDRLFEVSEKLESHYYINLQGDEPLFEFKNLALGIDAAKKYPNTIINFGTTIHSDDLFNPSIVKVCVNKSNFVEAFYRTYDYNLSHLKTLKHLGVYIINRDMLRNFAALEQSNNEKQMNVEMLRFLDQGFPIKLIEIETRSIGVDHPEDILRVEKILNN